MMVKKNPDVFVSNSGIHDYNTRQSNLIHKPRVNTTLAKRGPHFNCIEVYNKIPQKLRQIEDLKTFKKEMKEYLIREAFYSYQEYIA